MTDDRRWMVATVGLSPVPVVLSVLAVRPAVLVLVHTEDSAVEAGRIEEAVVAELGATTRVTSVSCGSGAGLRETYLGIQSVLERHVPDSQPYLLGYSGGTTAMVTAAVHLHITTHGDRPELRCYVDEQSGHMVTDDDERYEVASDLSLTRIAALHGYRLTGRCTAGEHRSVDQGLTDFAWRKRREPDISAQQLVDALHAAADWRDLQTGEPAAAWRLLEEEEARKGQVNELAHLAPLLGEPLGELGHSIRACPVEDPKVEIVEFDLVARRGQRVMVVEAKSSGPAALPVTGGVLVMAREVFGSATRALAVVPGHSDDDDDPISIELADQIGQWNNLLSPLERFDDFRPNGRTRKVREIRAVVGRRMQVPRAQNLRGFRPDLQPLPAGRYVEPPASGTGSPQPVEHLVTAVGGSPLAVQSALTVVEAQQKSAVATVDAWKALRVSRTVADAEPAHRVVSDLNATNVYAECRDRADATFVVTPGTKSATSGMVRASLGAGNGADLVHVDVGSGWAHSWRQGSWPHRPPVAWEGISNPAYQLEPPPNWWQVLSGPRTLEEQGFRPHRRSLERAVEWVASMPFDCRYSFDPRATWWVPLLFTGITRAVGVVAPAHDKHGRKVVMAAAQHLYSMVGDAGRLLVLLPSGARGSEALWTRPYRRIPVPIVGYQDMSDPGFAPAVVEAALR